MTETWKQNFITWLTHMWADEWNVCVWRASCCAPRQLKYTCTFPTPTPAVLTTKVNAIILISLNLYRPSALISIQCMLGKETAHINKCGKVGMESEWMINWADGLFSQYLSVCFYTPSTTVYSLCLFFMDHFRPLWITVPLLFVICSSVEAWALWWTVTLHLFISLSYPLLSIQGSCFSSAVRT